MALNRAKGRDYANHVVEPHLRKWVESDRDYSCKRVILDRYFDCREDRIECELDEEPCEGCEQKKAHGETDAEMAGDMDMDSSEPPVMPHETPFTSSFTNASDPMFSPVNVNAGVARYPLTSHGLPTRIPHQKEDFTRSSNPPAVMTPSSMTSATPQSSMTPAAAGGSASGSHPVGAEIVARHQQQVPQTQARIRQLREVCASLRGRCVYCYITAQPQGADHFMYRCSQGQCRSIKIDCYPKKKRIRDRKELAAYAGCTRCFLPQAWCN